MSNEKTDKNHAWFWYVIQSKNVVFIDLCFLWVSKVMHLTNLAIFLWAIKLLLMNLRNTKKKQWRRNNGIWTLNLSRDDPACMTLRYLCITYKYLKVLIYCLCTAGPRFSFTLYLTQFWPNKIIIPFLTAAQRKHIQIHVMKMCRQASVTNSLLSLSFFYFTNCTNITTIPPYYYLKGEALERTGS